jgi:hypothetical protein
MNNKGMALILGLFVVTVLAVLSSSFLYKQVNQSFLSNRFVDSTRAFWIAEAGVQEARDNLPGTPDPDDLGGGSYEVTVDEIGSSEKYFQVVSTGTFGRVTRTVDAVISTRDVDADNFKYGIESTVGIDFKGDSTVYGENTTLPVVHGTRDPEYYKEDSNFAFADLFCFSTTEIRALSTVYNDTWPEGNITGINWVIAPNSHFTGNIEGSGILIIEGDLKVTGTIDFDGIVYIIGDLDLAGTSYVGGSVLAESSATVTTGLAGTCDIEHNITKVQTALDLIKYRSPQIVSWKEIPE